MQLRATQGIDQRLVAEWGGSISVSDLSYLDLAKDVIRANIAFLVPLVVFVLGFVVKKARFTHDTFTQFFSWFFASYAVLAVAYVIFGLGYEMKQLWLHPFLIFTPFFLMLLFQQVEQPKRGWLTYKWGLIIFTPMVLIFRLLQSFASPYLTEHPHRSSVPILSALNQLPDGVRNSKGLCVNDAYLAGHFVLLNPKIRLNLRECENEFDYWIYGGLLSAAQKGIVVSKTDDVRFEEEIRVTKGSASYRLKWKRRH